MSVLSGLVCVHNEEARLAECLARLAFCDEIVVVADRCTDRSEAIARKMGARVVSGIFPVEGLRKEAGVAACRGDWIVELDADEAVTPALAQEIRQTIAALTPATGTRCPWTTSWARNWCATAGAVRSGPRRWPGCSARA
jgi:glycosyltransferase involved in cell wall biosynthesis